MSTEIINTVTVLRSDDLNCPSCVGRIEKAVGGMDGVLSVEVHFNSGRIEIAHDPARPPVAGLVAAIRRLGYESRPSDF